MVQTSWIQKHLVRMLQKWRCASLLEVVQGRGAMQQVARNLADLAEKCLHMATEASEYTSGTWHVGDISRPQSGGRREGYFRHVRGEVQNLEKGAETHHCVKENSYTVSLWFHQTGGRIFKGWDEQPPSTSM